MSGPRAVWGGAISYLKRPRKVSLGQGRGAYLGWHQVQMGLIPFPMLCVKERIFFLDAEDPDWGSHCAACLLCGLWHRVLVQSIIERLERAHHP